MTGKPKHLPHGIEDQETHKEGKDMEDWIIFEYPSKAVLKNYTEVQVNTSSSTAWRFNTEGGTYISLARGLWSRDKLDEGWEKPLESKHYINTCVPIFTLKLCFTSLYGRIVYLCSNAFIMRRLISLKLSVGWPGSAPHSLSLELATVGHHTNGSKFSCV